MRVMLIAPKDVIHSLRFFQMLLDAGHTVIYVDKRHNHLVHSDNYFLIPYPNYDFKLLNWVKPTKLKNFIKTRLISRKLRKIWDKFEPDVVHVHLINMSAYHCVVANLHPLILTIWGTEIWNFTKRRNKKKIIKAISIADHITADTEDILQRCEMLVGRKLNTSSFYYGIDFETFRSHTEDELFRFRQKIGLSSKTKIVLSIRRLIPNMGHHDVLTAFSDFVKTTHLEVVLIFRRFGQYNPEYVNKLKELANKLNVLDRLVWLNEIEYDQLPLLYSLADLIVNFPEHDGLPVSLFEASACLTPVITSDLDEYQSYLSKGAYFKVPSKDVLGLKEAMNFVLNEVNKKEIDKRLRINYELAYQEADQRKNIRKMEQIYHVLHNKYSKDYQQEN